MDAKQLGEMPAFASEHRYGMTLRQYYAGEAMKALCTRFGEYQRTPEISLPPSELRERFARESVRDREGIAAAAVEYADALLAELAKEQTNV